MNISILPPPPPGTWVPHSGGPGGGKGVKTSWRIVGAVC